MYSSWLNSDLLNYNISNSFDYILFESDNVRSDGLGLEQFGFI